MLDQTRTWTLISEIRRFYKSRDRINFLIQDLEWIFATNFSL